MVPPNNRAETIRHRPVPLRYIVAVLTGFAFFHVSQAFFIQFGAYYLFAGIGESALFLIGLVGGLPTVIGLLTVNFWGVLSDHWHRRIPIMLVGFAAQALAFAAYLVIRDTLTFLLVTCATSAFAAAAIPMANAYLTQATTHKGGAVGLVLATSSLGWFFGATGGGFLYDIVQMQGLFLLGAIMYVIGGVVIVAIAREIRISTPTVAPDRSLLPEPRSSRSKIPMWRFIFVLCLAIGLGTLGVNTFSYFFSIYMLHEIGGTAAMLGIGNGFASLSGLGLTLLAGYGSDRIGRKPVILLGFAGYAVFWVVFALVFDPWVATLLWVIPIYPLVYTGSYGAAADVSSLARRGRAMTAIATAFSIGTGVGPIVGGALVQMVTASLRTNMLLATALNALALLLVLVLVPETLHSKGTSKIDSDS
jgi:NNP family nitrate/nitrite transporter-like MFS transporter